jgi:glycosyltransferase involved in cell wall biosynthesis
VKLLVYSHFFPPSVGGVETIVESLGRGLASALKRDGTPEFDVTAVTETRADKAGDGLLPFRVERGPTLRQLWRHIRRADVIHAAGPALLPLLLAWLARKPVVIEHHGYQSVCPNGLLLHLPDRTICPGHFRAGNYAECFRCQRCEKGVLRSFAGLLLMFPRFWLSCKAAMNVAITKHVLERQALARSSVVYYGIEDPLPTDTLSRPAVRDSEKVCFAYVGRLVPEKGVAVLLEAARTLKEQGQSFEVLLIGDGPERPGLAAIAAREGLGNCVRFTGMLTGTALEEALREAHVVVMPSIWEETAGLSAIEQMMRGRLVIASDIGGLGEVVGDAALKFLPGSAGELANCMKRVLQNPSLIDGMGRKARERALRLFARRRMIEEHASAYHAVLGGRRPSPEGFAGDRA